MRHNGDTLSKIGVKMKRNEIDPAPEGVYVSYICVCVCMVTYVYSVTAFVISS